MSTITRWEPFKTRGDPFKELEKNGETAGHVLRPRTRAGRR